MRNQLSNKTVETSHGSVFAYVTLESIQYNRIRQALMQSDYLKQELFHLCQYPVIWWDAVEGEFFAMELCMFYRESEDGAAGNVFEV